MMQVCEANGLNATLLPYGIGYCCAVGNLISVFTHHESVQNIVPRHLFKIAMFG